MILPTQMEASLHDKDVQSIKKDILDEEKSPLSIRERPFIAIEKRLGQNLPDTFEVVDRWDLIHGIATSIKSTNLFCKTYQDPKKLGYLLKRYVNKVAEFKGDKLIDVEIKSHQIKVRGLDLAIPNPGTPAQQQVLKEIADYAISQNVQFNIFIIP